MTLVSRTVIPAEDIDQTTPIMEEETLEVEDTSISRRPFEIFETAGRRWKTSGAKKVSVGGYSRSYSEKRYQVNRTRQHEKHSNRSIQTETKVTFHRLTPGDFYGPFGTHKLNVRNDTFSSSDPNGATKSAEFSNITYFDGPPEDRGEDNVHPLTCITQRLITKELVDGGTLKFTLAHFMVIHVWW